MWGVAVDRVDPEGGHWVARSSAGDLHTPDVVLATGSDRVPVRPRWPGEARFPGAIRHAADVRRPRELAGRRVLIPAGYPDRAHPTVSRVPDGRSRAQRRLPGVAGRLIVPPSPSCSSRAPTACTGCPARTPTTSRSWCSGYQVVDVPLLPD